MSMTVKAYLDRGSENPEIRRFAVDQSVSASLAYLSGKISQVFPSLGQKPYNLFWKDSDGDLVSFSTDDELTEALGFINDGIFRVYIRPHKSADEPSCGSGVVHNGVICDSCEKEIRGSRFKCLTCPDYDLCSGCESQGKHTQHDMLRICTPRSAGEYMHFPFMGPHGHHHRGGHHPHGPPHGHHPPPPPPPGCPPPPPPPFGGPHAEGGEDFPSGPMWWGRHGHWRRMMKRCMRRMMKEQGSGGAGWDWNAAGCGEESGAASRDSSMDSEKTHESEGQQQKGGAEPSQREEERERSGGDSHEEYLRNMGESVAAMLDPLGIDVHVDIEHKGENKHVHGRGGRGRGRGRGRCGRGGGGWRGPWGGMFAGPWGWGGAQGMWGQQQQQQQQQQRQSGEEEKDDVEMQQDDAGEGPSKQQQAASAAGAAAIARDEMSVGSPAPQSDVAAEGSDWTLLGKDKDANEDTQMKSPQPDAQVVYPQLPQPPTNPGIADALEQMKAMGYNDDGGWLTSLLEAKGGSINKVLDALQPKPQ